MNYEKEKKKLWNWNKPTFKKSLTIALGFTIMGYINTKLLISAILCVLLSFVIWGIWYLLVSP